MDRQRLRRLNEILLEVSSRGRPVDDLDEIPSWFVGTEEEVRSEADEVRVLFDEAHNDGIINRWVEEHTHRNPSTNWDWTTTAHRRAFKKGLLLTNPMGEEEDVDE